MANRQNSVYEQVLKQFTFEGDQEDILQLHELTKMIASTPTGQRVLQDALNLQTPLIVSFCDGFKDKGTRGMFLWREQAVRLVKIDKNLPEMTDNDRIRVQIKMANIMAHELQHYIDYPRNQWLNKNAHTSNEEILALVLCEMSAFKSGDSVECELRTQNGMRAQWMPKTPDEWKEVMTRVLSGKNRRIKDYICNCRKVAQDRGVPFEQRLPSREFYHGVTDFLKKTNINMGVTEAMLCVSQSQKLLPMAKHVKTSRDR